MSDLGLDIASSSIAARDAELATAAQNLSNVSTPGYARETVNLSPLESATVDGAGQGVLVGSVSQATSSLYEQANLVATANLSAANQTASVSSAVQAAIDEPSTTGLQTSLNKFWSDLSTLATQPSNGAATETVVQDAANLATGLNSASSQLAATGTQLQQDLAGTGGSTGGLVGQANTLINQIAKLNAGIAAGAGGGLDVNSLVDSQRAALSQLSGLIGVRTATDQTGQVTVWAGGIELVQGTTANDLQVSGSAANADVSVTSTSGTAVPAGGQIGALLGGVNTTIPALQTQLNKVADSLAASLNPLQAAGTSASGTPGSANPVLFVNGGSATTYTPNGSSAASISVSAALLANPSLLSTASAGTVGASIDPGTTQAMAAVGQKSGGPDDLYAQLIGTIGSQGAAATADQGSAQALSNSTTAELASVEGVNTDEETVNMLSAQRAYQASAQIINAINTSFQSLLQAV
ncbi:MAG: flagellar hook-associated protein FlgK [Acidimicrobiaceae bacterium]|nr:flagellar hook-associated protein FlgK [Acidimicrobiaceae bacterium]